MKALFFTVILISLTIIQSSGQLIVTLSGMPNLNSSTLAIYEAGNDFNNSITESQPNTLITIQNNNVNNSNNYDYKVEVNLMEVSQNYHLEVERTGAGTNRQGGSATGRVTGGSPAIRLSATPVLFFEGTGDRLNIPIIFSLHNLSVTRPAGNISFSLVFTATAL
jgi:hypothetical protein